MTGISDNITISIVHFHRSWLLDSNPGDKQAVGMSNQVKLHQSDRNTRNKMVSEYTPGRISVIIPTFNRRDMVQEAIASVADQSWPDVEIIVVDDGSTDGTFDYLNGLKNSQPQKSLKLLYQENAGVAAARNRGLLNSSGEFLYFLDSDDLIFRDGLKSLAKAITSSRLPYALAHIHNSDQSGRILLQDRSGIVKLSPDNVLSNSWFTHAALYRRTTICTSGLFDPKLMIGEDTEFQWRIAALFGQGTVVQKYIGLRRQHNFGHLSIDRTDVEAVRHSLNARLSFAEWIKSKKMKPVPVSFSLLANFVVLGIRLGQRGEWQEKNDAFSLAERFNCSAAKVLLLNVIGWPNQRSYYLVLFLLVLVAKRTRNIWRFILSTSDSVTRRLNKKNIEKIH